MLNQRMPVYSRDLGRDIWVVVLQNSVCAVWSKEGNSVHVARFVSKAEMMTCAHRDFNFWGLDSSQLRRWTTFLLAILDFPHRNSKYGLEKVECL